MATTRVYRCSREDHEMDLVDHSSTVTTAAHDLLKISFGPFTNNSKKKKKSFQDLLSFQQQESKPSTTTNVIMDEDEQENTSMYLMMRRQRNRLSCRKARLKRKKETRNIEILVSKREERKKFLILFLERIKKTTTSTLLQDIQVRGFLARNLHYALCDEEYELPNNMTKDPNYECTLVFTLMPMLLAQWQAIKEPYENVDFCLDDVYENHTEKENEYEVTCQWHFLTSGTIPTSNSNEPLYANGNTQIHFHGKRVFQIQMELLSVRPMDSSSSSSSSSSSTTSPYLYHQQQEYHVCDIVQV